MSINSKMTALANAIRKKTGGTAALTLDGMATGLNNIPDNDASDVTVSGATVSIPKGNYLEDVSKSVTNQGTKTATLNTSTTSYTIPAGYHSGSGKVSITLEEKSATPSTSAQTITPTSGKVLSKVTVASIPSDYVPSGYVKPTATLAAKTYTPSTSAQTIAAGTYLSGVQTISAVPTQTKSATPSTTAQTIKPDTGKFLSSVSVGAIATETKSVTPTTSAQDVTPTSGKYLTKVSVGAISTQTKSATPTTSSQTIKPDSGKYLSSVTVNAIPSTYVPDGYVKPTATKAAATITPGTSNQTIAAGTYCSGDQTIAGDADLVSANIKAGANIFGVAGNANVVDTSAGTAVAGDMLSGKIAFVDGAKVTGTIESISVDGYGSAGGGHHTSQTAYFGAYTEGDSASYFYAFVPQYSYTGINSLIRIPAQNAQEAVGLEANDQIAAGSTVFGIKGASPIPVALLMSAAATSGTGGTSTAQGMMIDESFGSIDGGVFTASRAGTYYVASTYLGNTKFGSGSYQGNSYTAVNNSSGTSVANKSVTLSSGGTITITGTASKSSSSNTNGGSVAARAVVIYYTGR